MNLCKYKDALGVPGKGVHSYRIGGFAIVDIVLTFIGAFILSRIFNKNYWFTLVAFFLLGIVLHRIFCVKTTLDKLLCPIHL